MERRTCADRSGVLIWLIACALGARLPLPNAGAGDMATRYDFVRKWPDIPEAWHFDTPRGIAVDADGAVYVAETGRSRILKFDLAGVLVAEWGSEGSEDGELSGPGGQHGCASDGRGR